ncbi:hypothetical protein BZA05DRAFT_426535 [Tricharina praecox]|uniref:uncharacterized protein n=1 Tax=Tricharina praecox TaxID=43433 RepID=UPI00221F1AC2|nr:uncharacterized protein BZA05DRAFT_426535 [Tricharina praecox]KAI5848202.1 hypothetical protein BZA05DRAFT_426535 [Tricharina praecox]
MSIAQTFQLARKARGKLSSEASRGDHNLRLLVGHANLLDSLMIHLSEAEAEQERWYQNTVRGNEYDTEEYGSLAADYESDTESESDEDEEYEEDSDEEEEDEFEEVYYEQTRRTAYPAKPQPQRAAVIEVQEVEADFDDDEYENEEEDGMFTLTRTTSHRPPSLCSDASDDDEEDDHAPPSPPQPVEHHYPMSEKELRTISYFSSTLHDDHDSTEVLFEDRLLPTMISTF